MSYSINPAVWGNMFGLPGDITDKYLKMANESQIKSILWIFRNISEPVDAKVISKNIGKPVPNVEEALRYWASVGILNSEIATEVEAAPSMNIVPKKELPELPTIRPSEEQIRIRCQENPELQMFFNEVQARMGKTIGYAGQSCFLMMHDHYGLPVEVIFMLVDYCMSIGKDSFAYMEKIAKQWGEREIDSIEKADEIISNLSTCQNVWNKFTRLTGIQTPKPTSSQSRYLLTWVNEYKFSVDMLYCAYEIMADNCARTSFKYMDAILKDWYQKGYKNPEDTEKEKAKPFTPKQTGQAAKTSSSYDMDEFKRRADRLPVYNKGE